MENIELAKFNFNIDEVLKNASEIKKSIDEIKSEQADLRKNNQTASLAFIENEAALKVLNKEYSAHVKALAETTKQTADASTRQERMNVVLGQEVTTIQQAREQNKLLNELRNSANVTTKEGQEELVALNAQLDRNNAMIKENVDQYTQQKINIGNYKNDIIEATSLQGLMTNGIGGLTVALKGAVKGIFAMTKASLAFLATPIGAVIGALGVTLGLIINYLKSTQEGIDMVTKVTRPLSAIFQALIGVLQDVGKFLFEAFSRPKETLSDLYQFIKNQILRQFQAFGKILEGIFTLDFSKIKEGFQDLADQAKENLERLANVGKEFGNRMREAYRAGVEIDRLQKEIEQREIDIIGLRAKNSLALKEQENIMRNQKLTSEERTKAIEEHARLTEELVKAEEAIIVAQIEQLKLKQSLNDSSREDLKLLAELEAQLISINERRADSERTTQRIVKQLEDERNKEVEKALDKRLTKEKELIDLYIQQQGIQSKTLSEQFKMEQAVSEMRLAIFEKELKAKKISQEKYAREVLAITQNLARMEAEIAVENALREVKADKDAITEQIKQKSFLSDEAVKQRKTQNDQLLEIDKNFALLQLEQGLINQDEYDARIRELQLANRLANEALDEEREKIKQEEKIALRALEFEEELERMMQEGADAFDIQQAQEAEQREIRRQQIEADLENGIISEELYRARLAQIDREAKNAELQREQYLKDQKLALRNGMLNAIGAFVDQNSGAEKAIALAKAGMNTFEGITAGLKLGFPMSIPAVSMASATGLAAVRNISKTKIPKFSGQGSVSSPGGASTPKMNLTGKSVSTGMFNASENTTVQTDIDGKVNQSGIADKIREGVEAGAKAGSEAGSKQGITDLSENRRIQQISEF